MGKVAAEPIIFHGQTFTCVDDMPKEARQAYEQLMKAIDAVALRGAPDDWEEGAQVTRPQPQPPSGKAQRFWDSSKKTEKSDICRAGNEPAPHLDRL